MDEQPSTADASGSQFTGELSGNDDVVVREVTLTAGDGLRAVLRPTSPLQAQLLVLGPESVQTVLDEITEGQTTDVAYYLDENGAQPGQISASGELPGALLESSTRLAGGCENTQNTWVTFTAPTSGTYYLAVTRDGNLAGMADGPDGSSKGAFAVTYDVEADRELQPGDLAGGLVLDADALSAVSYGHHNFFLDPDFFPSAQFDYGAEGTPYANDSCSIEGGLGPMEILNN